MKKQATSFLPEIIILSSLRYNIIKYNRKEREERNYSSSYHPVEEKN